VAALDDELGRQRRVDARANVDRDACLVLERLDERVDRASAAIAVAAIAARQRDLIGL